MRTLLIAVTSTCLAACGGGGNDASQPAAPGSGGPTFAITTEAPLVESYSLLSSDDMVKRSSVWVGDSAIVAGGAEYRGIFRFDLSGVPLGATITSATFQTQRTDLGPTITHLGELWVDDVEFEAPDLLIGPNAMYGYLLEQRAARLQATLGGVYRADVGHRVQAAIVEQRDWLNLRARWDVSIYDNDVSDAYRFDYVGGPAATLVITYLP